MTRSLTLPGERKFCEPPQPVLFKRSRLRQVEAPVMNGRKAHKMSTTEKAATASRIVIVGASLAGLHAAEQLRAEGFDGHIVIIGDEPYEPYDRPPLSKQVLIGWVEASSTALPRRGALDVEWKLGVSAVGLDLLTKHVQLANGQEISFDRLLIATGTRARPWPNKQEASLDGLFVLRTRDDASRLLERLAAQPKRVLIIGAGFTGSEIASSCRELGLTVTVAERGPYPLVGALGGVIGAIAADIQRQNGVDLRCGVTITRLEGDERGRLQRAYLSDGSTLNVDLAVVALGVDVVASLAYPFPVSVICELLGVPRQDEERFHRWAEAIVNALNARQQADREVLVRKSEEAEQELGQYIATLAEMHRKQPGNDMFSGLVTDEGPDGRLSQGELITTGILLLIAGHETTVNLIANGVLTLLRHPEMLSRLRREPDLIVGTVEEVLRYEPPVQLLPQRTPLEDISIAGTVIPKGAPLTLALAAGNRDPQQFVDPERFDPGRKDNQHLSFSSGIHYCFGAPLARLEAQVALSELFRRLEHPRLVVDPPPYRQNPLLRGPSQLLIEVDGVKR